ncbi:lytic murein transglycosylase [Oricola sp.]|uniref:lytic murein transglycosylase n=1 Tax=Oricola sp. TaxID=1979950 RepID=UPI003BAA9BDD
MTLRLATIAICALAAVAIQAMPASAAQCGNTSAGFEAWKVQFTKEARAKGIGNRGLKALAGTRYATKTIAADRNQKSFRYSLSKFMQVRGANAIVSQGRKRKRVDARLLSSIERKYGVPAGPLLAIHGMETGFGRFMGNANVVSAIATLAYDCRRSKFFTGHLYAALQLVDRGIISANTKGAMHGEIGHTQFLPGSVLKYGVDGDRNGRIDLAGSKADALASTANFLRAHGWRPGRGYQPGQANFRAIQGWNAAGVYQKAIAIMAAQIDQ